LVWHSRKEEEPGEINNRFLLEKYRRNGVVCQGKRHHSMILGIGMVKMRSALAGLLPGLKFDNKRNFS
jgi:hypothetical protein